MNTRTLHVERSTSTAHRLTHYDGVCGNIHGHNMHWEVHATVSMENAGDDNMPVDLKMIADLIDEVDHACLLNEGDRLTESFHDDEPIPADLFGDVILFEGDPTCEVMAQWMAERILRSSTEIKKVELEVAETDKYSISVEHP